MGKLFFSRVTVFVCLLLTTSLQAQDEDNYCVFQVNGKPMLNDSLVLAKGNFIYPGDFLTLKEGDKLLLSDENGIMYEINKKVTMPYDRISFYTKKEKQSSFTIAYLKYVWKKLWGQEERQNAGVVYRAPNSKMLAPVDSAQIYMTELSFEWISSKKPQLNYLYLVGEGESDTLKIATNGSTLILPVGDAVVKPKKSYRWALGTANDLNSEALIFRNFTVLDELSFEERMVELNEVKLEFMALGLSEDEIKRTFCQDQKLCFN